MTIEKTPVSLCGRCRHYDWSVGISVGHAKAPRPTWNDECTNPAEYTAGDDVQKCEGFSE